jgi:ubiquinone biosynthesis protein
VLAEFREALRKELDYTVEAAHLKRFASFFDEDPTVRIPKVYESWTTERVLTMERLPGVKVSALDEGGLPEGLDGQEIARRGADAILTQIFIHGFFHADPHPGNVLVLPGNVVGFIDLGQVGRLDREMRILVADLFGGLVSKDVETATESFLELTESTQTPDRGAIEAEIAEFVDWYVDRPVGELEIGKMVWRLLEIAGRHRRSVSPELYLVLKALATLEVFARRLDPQFDLAERAGPVLKRLMRERFSPRRWALETWQTSVELTRLAQEIPRELRQILAQIRRGRLHVEFEHTGLAPLLHTHEVVVNRLVFAIVLAALLIASSLVALGDIPPKWHGIPVLGVFGYALSAVTGLALLWSILRRGRL